MVSPGITDSDIQYLLNLDITPKQIEMYKLSKWGTDGGKWSFKKIAEHLGYKSPVTVSRNVKKVEEALSAIHAKVQSGEIAVRSSGMVAGPSPAPSAGYPVVLQAQNPFHSLQRFEEIAAISNDAGQVFGMGASMVARGFLDDRVEYGERYEMVTKGGAVLMGGIFAAYASFQQFTSELDALKKRREIPPTDAAYDVTGTQAYLKGE